LRHRDRSHPITFAEKTRSSASTARLIIALLDPLRTWTIAKPYYLTGCEHYWTPADCLA
jgi:hypothetical protein